MSEKMKITTERVRLLSQKGGEPLLATRFWIMESGKGWLITDGGRFMPDTRGYIAQPIRPEGFALNLQTAKRMILRGVVREVKAQFGLLVAGIAAHFRRAAESVLAEYHFWRDRIEHWGALLEQELVEAQAVEIVLEQR